ncbi:MAG: hypothetical protein JOZ49_12105 [Mycolicibacterium sp.]|nr:hypothetical protein [Mycolicibacterium sp.]
MGNRVIMGIDTPWTFAESESSLAYVLDCARQVVATADEVRRDAIECRQRAAALRREAEDLRREAKGLRRAYTSAYTSA